MKRRDFLLGVAAGSAALGLRVPRAESAGTAAQQGWRTFEVVTRVDVADPAGATRRWLPVPMRQPTDYQRTLDTHREAPSAHRAKRIALPGYGIELLAVEWPDAPGVGTVTVTRQVQTRDRRVALAAGKRSTAASRRRACTNSCARPSCCRPTASSKPPPRRSPQGNRPTSTRRAIYEWVVDNTARSEDARRRRRRCRQHARNHHPSGKCADINALFVALARTANIPARDAYGVRVADSRLEYHCIGRSGDVSKTQHCRAEFYAQSHGWIPVDPADVRKLMLEEAPGGPPATDSKVQSARALLFGNWEMNWIAYNHGHDIALPNQAGKPVPFLMYPNGETAERRLDRLDPSAFRYSITSREIAA